MKVIAKGQGICGGFVEGKAKIITDLSKSPESGSGYILVVPFFTPLMTMLIPKSKAIIADFGGITCHTAVIAREFNIPCVVGLNNITSKIKDGQIIAINAERGEIYEI